MIAHVRARSSRSEAASILPSRFWDSASILLPRLSDIASILPSRRSEAPSILAPRRSESASILALSASSFAAEVRPTVPIRSRTDRTSLWIAAISERTASKPRRTARVVRQDEWRVPVPAAGDDLQRPLGHVDAPDGL